MFLLFYFFLLQKKEVAKVHKPELNGLNPVAEDDDLKRIVAELEAKYVRSVNYLKSAFFTIEISRVRIRTVKRKKRVVEMIMPT